MWKLKPPMESVVLMGLKIANMGCSTKKKHEWSSFVLLIQGKFSWYSTSFYSLQFQKDCLGGGGPGFSNFGALRKGKSGYLFSRMVSRWELKTLRSLPVLVCCCIWLLEIMPLLKVDSFILKWLCQG